MPNFRFADLWRQVAIPPKDRRRVGMTELLSHSVYGGASLDKLTSVGVPETMERECVGEAAFPDCDFEWVFVVVPW